MGTDKRIELADFKKFKPYLESALALIIYLRFGNPNKYADEFFENQAKNFINKLEKDITENGN